MGSVHLMAAMLGSGRNQLSRSILRQVTAKNGRDARSLASLVNISAGKEIVKSGVTGVSKQPQVWEPLQSAMVVCLDHCLEHQSSIPLSLLSLVCMVYLRDQSSGTVKWSLGQ